MSGFLWDPWLIFLDQVSVILRVTRCYAYAYYAITTCQSPVYLLQTNLVVTGLTACFNLYTRSAGVLYFTTGAVVCSLSVKLIKRVIRQPRPPNSVLGRKAKVSYGYAAAICGGQMEWADHTASMPSTHSATISYFAAYILLASRYLPVHPSLGLQREAMWRFFPPFVCLPWAVSIMMSRVWLRHHTWPQVFAGASYGIFVASVWFALWTGGWNNIGQRTEEAFNII